MAAHLSFAQQVHGLVAAAHVCCALLRAAQRATAMAV